VIWHQRQFKPTGKKKRNLKISKKNAKKRTIIEGFADHSEEQKGKARRKSSGAEDH